MEGNVQKQTEKKKQQTAKALCSCPNSKALLLSLRLCLGRRHGVGREHSGQQVLDDLILALLAGGLDLLDLGSGFAVGLLLGGLVALRVLMVLAVFPSFSLFLSLSLSLSLSLFLSLSSLV